LVSGGKDSCYSMVQCVAAGHQIVGLVNLGPHDTSENELDSYMYQTVGHQAIHLYSEAIGLPLFRGTIKKGRSLNTDMCYQTTVDDEVEDLYRVLKNLLDPDEGEGPQFFTAVCSGAILSDYQRIRVEHVCSRLGLVSLGYLWRRDQSELLDEMVDNKIESVLIKTATLGLDHKHLGLTLAQVRDHLHKMSDKYGINVCGEGGEYETFTLDCPLFRKRIVLDETETEVEDVSGGSPVTFLKIKSASLKDKELPAFSSQLEMIRAQIPSPETTIQTPLSKCSDVIEEEKEKANVADDEAVKTGFLAEVIGSESAAAFTKMQKNRFFSINDLSSDKSDPAAATAQVLSQLKSILSDSGVGMSTADIVSVNLMVSSMNDFASINREYVRHFGANPPVRVCVQAPISERARLLMSVVVCCTPAQQADRHTMHVQGVSHWAPANIGPYSQAVKIKGVLLTAGQIGMIPGTLDMVKGVGNQTRLSMRSLNRVLHVYGKNVTNSKLAVCYTTSVKNKEQIEAVWRREVGGDDEAGAAVTSRLPVLTVLVVPRLPKDADVEWHVIVDAASGSGNDDDDDDDDDEKEGKDKGATAWVLTTDEGIKVSTIMETVATSGRIFFTATFIDEVECKESASAAGKGSTATIPEDVFQQWLEAIEEKLSKKMKSSLTGEDGKTKPEEDGVVIAVSQFYSKSTAFSAHRKLTTNSSSDSNYRKARLSFAHIPVSAFGDDNVIGVINGFA